MAISYPIHETQIKLILKNKKTNTPLSNRDIKISFNTEGEPVLGGFNVSNEIITTDSNGIIDTTIRHSGAIIGELYATFEGDDNHDPITIEVPKLIWKPELNGETGASYQWEYSESNGEAIGKGFIFNQGFENTNKWKVNFDFKHDNIRYTGICFLAKLGAYNGGGEGSNIALTSWEGSWPNGTAYANSGSGNIDWFDVSITKIDSTHVRLQSITLDRDTVVEVSWLPTATQLSFGARHNYTPNTIESRKYGPCRIKNIEVAQYYDD